MRIPTSTGQAAKLLLSTEPRLNDLIRKGKLNPEPPVVAGRRLWGLRHIIDAGAKLGLDIEELRRRLDAETSYGA